MTVEQIQELTDKYVAENDGSNELPIFISKKRLDEVIGQKKEVEKSLADLTKLKEELDEQVKTYQDNQSKDVKVALDEDKKEWDKIKNKELETLKRDYEISDAIREAKGRNAKAIKALMDPKKDYKEELARLQESDGYLFGDDNNLPPGTGKTKPTANENVDAEVAQMRKAVGLG